MNKYVKYALYIISFLLVCLLFFKLGETIEFIKQFELKNIEVAKGTIQGLSMAENSNQGFNYFYTEITIDSVFNDTVNVYYAKSLMQTSGTNKYYQFASSNVDTMHLCIEGDSTAAGDIGDTDSLCIRLFALAPDSGLVLDSLDLVTDLDWDVEKVYTYKFPVYRQGAGYRAMIWRHCGAEDCIFKCWFQR